MPATNNSTKLRCDGCGKFMSEPTRTEFTPLNEFGPEAIDLFCGACADALGREFTERYASAEDCAAAIVTQALLCPDFVEQDA